MHGAEVEHSLPGCSHPCNTTKATHTRKRRPDMNEAMKQDIKDFALQLGVDDVGFAAASAYHSPLTPALDTIFPQAKTLIVMAYREASHCESENMRIAMGGRMAIADFMKSSTYKLSHFLERRYKAK